MHYRVNRVWEPSLFQSVSKLINLRIWHDQARITPQACVPFCYKSPFSWAAGQVEIQDELYNIYLVPESLALKIPALMGLGSVEPGLRKTQAAGPKEKKTVSGGKNNSLVPLIQLLQSFNKVSIVFVTCLVFCFVKFFLVYCPVSWWWQQPLVHHEFRKKTYRSVFCELSFW